MVTLGGFVFANDSLVAYWPLDGNAEDASGHELDGICVNGPVWASDGLINACLSLDGLDDYVEIPGYTGIPGGASRTCMAWINTTQPTGEIITWGDNNSGGRWVIRVNEGGQLRAEVQGGNIIGTTLINDGDWHYIAVVLEDDSSPDITEVRLYVDGNLETISASVDEPVNTGSYQNVQIGMYYIGERYFEGLIDDVRIYDRALSEAEIDDIVGPVLSVSSNRLLFSADEAGANPVDQTLTVQNPGGGVVNWSLDLTDKPDWLTVTPTSGVLGNNASEPVTLSVDTTGRDQDFYQYVFDVTDSNANNSPQAITVFLGIGDIYVPGIYPTIQAAINAAQDGDTVFVRDGIYTGEGNRDIDFQGKAITVKSENGPENCIIDCQGTEQDPHRGFNFHSGESRNSILDGITIINGTTEDTPFNGGGAIACKYRSNPTIKNCILKNNTTGERQGGGGIYCHAGSKPYIFECTISDNTAGHGEGGGIYTIASHPIIENCVITNNHNGATHFGGSPGSSPQIINCLIAWNYGVGIACDNRSHPKIINSTIYGNISYAAGGIDSFAGCSIQISNSIIWGNYGYNWQTGKYDRLSQIQIGNDYIEIDHSCIQGGKEDIRISDYFDDRYDTPPPSVIMWEDSNIDADPHFIDPIQHDLRLGIGSPCIETGKNSYVSAKYDLAGNPRVLDGDYDGKLVVDMGAYEALKSDFPVISLSAWDIELINHTGGSQPDEYKLEMSNSGEGEFTWQIINIPPWLDVTPSAGTISSETQEIILTIPPELEAGNYSAELTVSSPDALNSPQVIRVLFVNIGETLPVPSQFASIQEAVDYARNGDTIVIDDGVYTGTENAMMYIYKSIMIRSKNGPENCIIDCERDHPAIYCSLESDASLVIKGLTIINAIESQERSPVEMHGNVVLKDCRIENCQVSRYFGSIFMTWGAVLEGCEIINNMTGIYCYNNVLIKNCEISNNYAGPAIYCRSIHDEIQASNIILCNIQNNDGGGILLENCSPAISNCIIKDNVVTEQHDGYGIGGGIICFLNSNPTIKNSLIEGNYAQFGGGGISCENDSSPSLSNCTLVGNKAGVIGGGIWAFNESSLDVENSIIVENISSLGSQIAQEYPQYPGNSIVTLNYNCLQMNDGDVFDGESLQVAYGNGNLAEVPQFSIPGYWDDRGTSEDWTDDAWYSGVYNLQENSPCIDAGNPDYVPDPNELDLDGNPRLKGLAVDMGAYEFNYSPVADAGGNQTVYAWIDGLADVQLDGTGSYDADGDALAYFWYNDADELIATGAEPNVVLGVGEHVITLIVNDGVEDSEPDWCVVTVVEAIEGDARVLPRVFNLKRHSDKIVGWLTLPDGVGADALDPDESMLLLPGEIEPAWQRVLRAGRGWHRRASVVAFYDADLLRDELTANTMQEITLVVKLESGQFVYGTDSIRVIDLMPKKQQKKKFERIQSRSYSKPGKLKG